jgi:hypothetical protein
MKITKKVHKEGLNKLNSAHNIVSMIKSRIRGWEVRVACFGELTHVFKILVEKCRRKMPL